MRSSNSIIQSLDRGLAILEIVANRKRPVSINELASILAIDRSSVSRLANTLQKRGFLMYADGTREFVLGSGLWRLANHYPWIDFLTRLSSGFLKKLARDTGETAHLAIREGTKTIIVDNEMSKQPLSVSVNTGDEGLLHCTSVGKALIMDYGMEELELLFSGKPLKSLTGNTIRSLADLQDDLVKARGTGFTFDNEEFYRGVRCVAAPIRDQSGKILAAVGVSAPSGRLPDDRIDELGSMVKHSAEKIGNKIRSQDNRVKEHPDNNPKY